MINNNLNENKKSGLMFTLMMVIYLMLSVIGSIFITILNIGDYSMFISVLFPALSFVITYILTNEGRGGFFEKTNVKRFSPYYLIFALFICFSMLFYVGNINVLFIELLNRIGVKTPKTVIPLNNVFEYILAIVTIAIIPAISEELFFRGLLYNSLKKHGEIFAIIISSLCFAIYHCSISQLIYQFIFGLMFGLLVYTSKSVISGIICHFINNALIITLSFFKISFDYNNIAIKIVGIILLSISLFVLVFKLIKRERHCGQYRKIYFFFPFGILGILVGTLLAILSVVL